MDNRETKFSFRQIFGKALVIRILFQAKIGKVISDLEVEAQKAGQVYVVYIHGRGEQLHQTNCQVKQTTY